MYGKCSKILWDKYEDNNSMGDTIFMKRIHVGYFGSVIFSFKCLSFFPELVLFLIISQRYYLQDGGVGVEIVQDFAGFGIEG